MQELYSVILWFSREEVDDFGNETKEVVLFLCNRELSWAAYLPLPWS